MCDLPGYDNNYMKMGVILNAVMSMAMEGLHSSVVLSLWPKDPVELE